MHSNTGPLRNDFRLIKPRYWKDLGLFGLLYPIVCTIDLAPSTPCVVCCELESLVIGDTYAENSFRVGIVKRETAS